MKNIKIGIAVAAYIPTIKHLQSLINRCINSLNIQTRKPDIVAFLINGLDDAQDKTITEQNIRKFIEDNCKFQYKIFVINEKTGCAAARNLCFELMENEIDYMGFLDVDDRYDPRKLEMQESYILNNPNVHILGTHHYDVNKAMNGAITISTDPSNTDSFEKIKERIEKENCIVGASVLINKNMFKDLDGFDLSQIPGDVWHNHNRPMWEDWDFWIRAIRSNYEIHVLPERLYQWHHDLGVGRYFNLERYKKQTKKNKH